MDYYRRQSSIVALIGLWATIAMGQATQPATQASQADSIAVTVNGHAIMESDVRKMFDTTVAYMGGGQMSESQTKQLLQNVWPGMVGRLIDNYLVDEQIKRTKLTITDAELAKMIESGIESILVNQRISREVYETMVKARLGMTLEQYVAKELKNPEYRQAALRRKLLEKTMSGKMRVTEEEIQERYKLLTDKQDKAPSLKGIREAIIEGLKLEKIEPALEKYASELKLGASIVYPPGKGPKLASRPATEVGSDSPPEIQKWQSVPELPQKLAVYESVFWAPEDTGSLRKLIMTSPNFKGKTVLEIGTGTGLISLCALQAGSKHVVATDINPNAVLNARFNAKRLGYENQLNVRLVSEDNPSAYSVIGENEKFDIIVSNPPWRDATPQNVSERAFFDPDFELMKSLLKDMSKHLNPGGMAYLAYGDKDAIKLMRKLSKQYDLKMKLLDDRKLESLPRNFWPGMLIEITPIQYR